MIHLNAEYVQSIHSFFNNSVDLEVKECEVAGVSAFLCYYSTLINTEMADKHLELLEKRAVSGSDQWGNSATSSAEAFNQEKLAAQVCMGNLIVIFPDTNMMLAIQANNAPKRSPEEPEKESVVRGPHEGFIENIAANVGMVRKRLQRKDLVMESFHQEKTFANIHLLYLSDAIDSDVLTEIQRRIREIPYTEFYSVGQIEDYVEDNVYTPFPLYINTERPDRVTYNLLEGKVAIFIESSPTTLIGPANFYAFYESPDDYNSRIIVGSFYRMVRVVAFFTAILLPAFYISVLSFHSEILPLELAKTAKLAVNDIPYRPLFEAIVLELFIELIREASIRLPQRIGQTVGIVGGIIIGDAIVSAGLASSLMVIVVAMTAIASYVIPSVEMNMAVRLIRFPFMILGALLGFLGMVIGTLFLFIHLLNLTSLGQPYLSPITPFDPSRFKDVFFRVPYFRPDKQQKTFTSEGNRK